MEAEFFSHTEEILNLIDFKLLILIVVMARWSKRYLKDVFVKIPFSYKVLFLSTILSIAYFFIGRNLGFITNDSFFILLITYFTATSFYELIYSPIENVIIKRFGNVPDDSTPQN